MTLRGPGGGRTGGWALLSSPLPLFSSHALLHCICLSLLSLSLSCPSLGSPPLYVNMCLLFLITHSLSVRGSGCLLWGGVEVEYHLTCQPWLASAIMSSVEKEEGGSLCYCVPTCKTGEGHSFYSWKEGRKDDILPDSVMTGRQEIFWKGKLNC